MGKNFARAKIFMSTCCFCSVCVPLFCRGRGDGSAVGGRPDLDEKKDISVLLGCITDYLLLVCLSFRFSLTVRFCRRVLDWIGAEDQDNDALKDSMSSKGAVVGFPKDWNKFPQAKGTYTAYGIGY